MISHRNLSVKNREIDKKRMKERERVEEHRVTFVKVK